MSTKPQTSMSASRTVSVSITRHGGPLLWSGVVAVIVGSIVPLAIGLATGWSLARTLLYTALALLFLGLSQLPRLQIRAVGWLLERLWLYVLLMSMIALALQTISGDPFLQPILFVVIFVFAASAYDQRTSFVVAAWLLGLMVLGLLLHGERFPAALVLPVAGYGSAMSLVVAFTQLSFKLANERDYLRRLVQINASLARDLDLHTVLELVATAGCELANASAAQVWLNDNQSDSNAAAVPQLAVAVPAAASIQPSSDVRRALDPQTNIRAAIVSEAGLIVPLRFKDVTIGVLELVDDQIRAAASQMLALRLQPFADAAAVAIENARLFEQAGLSATLAERNRLARELHDTIAQGLTAMTMQLEAALRSFERDPSRTRTRVERALVLARATLEDVRRSVWTLAAPLVDGATVSNTLDQLVTHIASRASFTIHYTHSGPAPTLDHGAALQVLRIVQEALQNIEKHAAATEVEIRSETQGADFRVVVRDNGRGFDPAAPVPRTTASNGFGLVSLRERARLAGGTLSIESAPGAGTCVTLCVPLLEHEAGP